MKNLLKRWIPAILLIIFCLYESRKAAALLEPEQCLLWIIAALVVVLIEIVIGIYKDLEQNSKEIF